MSTLGGRLREVRLGLSKKTTQQKFAEMCGTTRSAYTTYEYDKVVPTDAFLLLVSEKFNISYDWLKTGKGEKKAITDAQIVNDLADQYGLDGAQRKILNIFLHMDPKKREIVSEAFFAFVEEYQKDEEADIEAEVENYRQERIAEKKKSEESGVNPKVENGA